MAKLTAIYNEENRRIHVGRRQLSINVGDNLNMLMDLNSKGLVIDWPRIEGCALKEFSRKYHVLNSEELHASLVIDRVEFTDILNQSISCIACRKRVERLYEQLSESGQLAVDPLIIDKTLKLSIREDKLANPAALGTLLCRHHEVLNSLTDSKLRYKPRCAVHSLDTFRMKLFSETWREIWAAMSSACRHELTIIDMEELHGVLDGYLKKHKFCSGCRSKIEKAYKILVGEEVEDEKGFVDTLYASICKCATEQHIHICTGKIEFMDSLIKRAEPEMNCTFAKLRERHAKTMEVAQEEVLTCVGMVLYERFRRVQVSLREEERACQVLAAVGVHALCRNFNTCVERKQGITNLELFCKEYSRDAKVKEQKRELKKLKKKQKKLELRHACEHAELDEDTELKELENDYEEVADVCNIDDNVCKLEDTGVECKGECNKEQDHCCGDGDSSVTATEPLNTTSKTTTATTGKKLAKNANSKKSKSKKKKHLMIGFAAAVKKSKGKLTLGEQLLGDNIFCEDAEDCDECHSSTLAKPCNCDVRDSGYGSDQNCRAQSPSLSERSSPVASVGCSCDGICVDEYEGDEKSVAAVAMLSYEYTDFFEERPKTTETELELSLIGEWQRFIAGGAGGDAAKPEEIDEMFNIPQTDITSYLSDLAKEQGDVHDLCIRLREHFQRYCIERGVPLTADIMA